MKLVGTGAGMGAFFAVYFWLLKHPLFPVRVMPLTAVDRWIGIHAGALPLYLSLWLYVSLAPALTANRAELRSVARGWLIISAVGLGIFLCWPTAVPPTDIDWSDYPSLAFLKSADEAGNACPSLHVAFAAFSGAWLARALRQIGAGRLVRFLNWAWCAGIIYSTLAVRQHVLLDVLAGTLLGAGVFVAVRFRTACG